MLDYISVSLLSQESSEMILHLASYTEQQMHAFQKNNRIKRQIRSLNVVNVII